MYDGEIEAELETCDSFQGVFMSDTIPTNFKSSKQGIIINLDSSEEIGSHWVAFWRNTDGSGEYFDSFGAPPPFHIQTSLEVLSQSELIYSNVSLQHESSSSCGLYCIFFIKHKCLGLSLPCILSHFSRSKGLNEIIVTMLNPACK